MAEFVMHCYEDDTRAGTVCYLPLGHEGPHVFERETFGPFIRPEANAEYLRSLIAAPAEGERPMGDLEVPCVGGGNAYVGHGADCVLLAFTAEVGWWRNSVGMSPDAARRLAAVLVEQADASVEEPSDG